MRREPAAFRGMNFNINLAKELKRVSVKDVRETKFDVRSIDIFEASTINPFPAIPDSVSRMVYRLDVSGFEPLTDEEQETLIREF